MNKQERVDGYYQDAKSWMISVATLPSGVHHPFIDELVRVMNNDVYKGEVEDSVFTWALMAAYGKKCVLEYIESQKDG